MINKLIIFRVMGSLILIEAGLLLLSLCIGLIYQEYDISAFAYTTGIATAIGSFLWFIGRKAENHMTRRDGYIVVACAWTVFSLIGMLPYLFSGFIPNIADAFFETMSGFTATGATILDNIEEGGHGLLFWRSMTQWLGGLGIVFFTLAILPIFGLGEVKLFAAEAIGPTHDKLHPRISTTAQRIWTVYSALTLACMGFLMLGGLDWFDALCHSMTCTATGGFSTYQDSIAHFDSAYVEYVIAFFMFFCSINFTLTYHCFFQGHIKRFWKDTELRWFTIIVTGAVAICTFCLWSRMYHVNLSVEESFRKALFQVVSIVSTTGFATDDYNLWPHVTWSIMACLMFMGGCAGSTVGGFKAVRIVMLTKIVYNEFKHILRPNSVLPVRLNDKVIDSSMRTTLCAFLYLYILTAIVATILFNFMGMAFSESIGLSLSSLSNIGPAFGRFGPAFSWSALPDAGKYLASFLMLIGRLEIFAVLLLFTPQFWRKR